MGVGLSDQESIKVISAQVYSFQRSSIGLFESSGGKISLGLIVILSPPVCAICRDEAGNLLVISQNDDRFAIGRLV